MIRAKGFEVQIDEFKFGNRKYHKVYQIEDIWIVRDAKLVIKRKLVLIQVEEQNLSI